MVNVILQPVTTRGSDLLNHSYEYFCEALVDDSSNNSINKRCFLYQEGK